MNIGIKGTNTGDANKLLELLSKAAHEEEKYYLGVPVNSETLIGYFVMDDKPVRSRLATDTFDFLFVLDDVRNYERGLLKDGVLMANRMTPRKGVRVDAEGEHVPFVLFSEAVKQARIFKIESARKILGGKSKTYLP